MRPTPLLFVTLFFAAGALTQQEPARADKPGAPKAPFVFEAGTVELRALVERCGAYLQRNVLLDDGELFPSRGQRQGAANAETTPTIELQLPIVTDRDGCEEVLAHLLWSRNLALTPLDEGKGLWEVLSIHGPRAREIVTRAVHRTPEQVLARPALRQFVSVVCTLEHTNAMIATNALRPFFAQTGHPNAPGVTFGNIGNTAAVLVTGPQDLVAIALRTLQQADVPQPDGPRLELDQRVEQLAQQLAALQQRLAALEQKPAKGG